MKKIQDGAWKKTQARDLTLIGLVEGIPTDHCPAPQKKFTGPSKIYYSFNARSKIDVGEFPFLKPHVLLLSSSSFFPFHHKPFRQDKMADEVYDGAIGIDLGKSITLDILFQLSSFCDVSIVCAVGRWSYFMMPSKWRHWQPRESSQDTAKFYPSNNC